MKTFLTISLLTFASLHFLSCQIRKPVETVFISTQKDSATGFNEQKLYKLKKKAINADFCYSELADIDGGNTRLAATAVLILFRVVNNNQAALPSKSSLFERLCEMLDIICRELQDISEIG